MADQGPWTKFQAGAPSGPSQSSPTPTAAATAPGPWAKYGGASPQVTPAVSPAAPPVPSGVGAAGPVAPKPVGTAVLGINRSGSQMGAGKVTFDDFMKDAEAWARGASFGTSDDASAGIAAAILKAKGDPRALGEIYQQLDAVENARIDSAGTAGKVAEGVGMLTGPGVARIGQWIGKGAGALGKMGRAALAGAGGGAVGGAGYGEPGEKTKSAAEGAVTGAIVGPVADRAAAFIGPRISDAAQYLRSKGVRPTIGQNVGGAAKAAEEKLSSIPLAGDLIKNQQRAAIEDFNRAAYNEVLAPLGKNVPKNFPVGNDGFAKVDDMISGEYDKLLPKLTFHADPQFQMQIAGVDHLADALPEAQKRAYINIMNTQFAGKLDKATHTMDGNTFKGAESELSRQIRGLASDPSWDQKELGGVLRKAQQVMRDTLARNNPKYSGELQKLNQSYMLLTRVKDATERLGAKDGVIMPTHLLSASKKGAMGKSFARGQAPLQELAQAGDATLSNKYPDSGSIGRLLLAEGGLGMINPKAAAGVAGVSAPYLLPRGWNASPFAQGSAALLRQAIPALASQAGGFGQRYIGPSANVPRVTLDQGTPQ